MAEVGIDPRLRESVLINRALVGKDSLIAVQVIRGTILSIDDARIAAGDTVAALSPGPSHRVACRDVDFVRYKHIAALPHGHIEDLAATRWHAAHGRLPVLIHNADPGSSELFRLRRAGMFIA